MRQPTDRDQDTDSLNRRSFLNRAMVLAVCPASFSVTTREGVGSHFPASRLPCGWSSPENDSRPRVAAAPLPCDDCTPCTSRFCRFRVIDLARKE